MNARLRQILVNLGETFWLLPAILVIVGILLAVALVDLDRSGLVPQWLVESPWLYNGGGTGARTLLGAVASSTIGVGGTVFSITIASLSLATGQMGPRLLRNFVRDRSNHFTLGAFLGTFSYALMVLRSVRTQSEGSFVPHASMTVGILLAFLCAGVLVFFVGHMAGRIDVDTVIEPVSADVRRAIERLTTTEPVRDGRPCLAFPVLCNDGLVDAMFHMIRQNAAGSPAVLIRMIEVMTVVVGCERQPERGAVLQRHADLVLADGERDIANPDDREELRVRHARFAAMRAGGPLAVARGVA